MYYLVRRAQLIMGGFYKTPTLKGLLLRRVNIGLEIQDIVIVSIL